MEINEKETQEIIDSKIEYGTRKYGKDFKYTILEIISLEKILHPNQTKENTPKLIPLVKWNEHHPDPSVKALRMLVFRQNENGFDKVIVKRGHRILIDEQKYFEWAEKNSKHPV